MTIVVVGAGLAGIAASVALTDAGHRVLLYERSRFLGGRAGSAYDKAAGCDLDLGQHVYLYCCHRYRGLLHRLGSYDHAPIQSPMRISVIDARTYPKRNSVATLFTSPLPTGLHLAPAFLRYAHLSASERIQTARTLLRLARLDRHAPKYQSITFGDWLRTQGATENAVESFWNVVTVAALNASVNHVSAAWGLMLFQFGLIGERRAAEVGVPQVPLSQLVSSVEQIVHDGGGRLHLGTGVDRVHIQGGSVKGVSLADGGFVPADAVIVSVAHKQLGGLLPLEVAADPFFAEVRQLRTRSIVDVHLGFTRRVVPPDFDFGVFLHSPLQWVFAHENGTRIAVSISDPQLFARQNSHAIKAAVITELKRLWHCPSPDWAVVRRHQNATFDVGPGSDRFRRPQRTPIAGLYLAGDWTHTDWPATMEGAVHSGELAASALLKDMAKCMEI